MRKVIVLFVLFMLCAMGVNCQVEYGKASFYGGYIHTANGEHFDSSSLTAAHKTLPFHSIVRVENVKNGKSVDVRVNNRGPYKNGRIIDLTEAGFRRIAPLDQGLARIKLTVLSLGHGRVKNVTNKQRYASVVYKRSGRSFALYNYRWMSPRVGLNIN